MAAHPTPTVMPLAFLSYRRDDAWPAAQAIYAQMKVYFGSGQLFMDVNSITPSEDWPVHIRSNVERASGMLVLIGPRWLHTADRWGRRRIDQPGDWVLREVGTALDREIPVLPVLHDGAEMPPADALPGAIGRLAEREYRHLRRDTWLDDLRVLADVAQARFGLRPRDDIKGKITPYPNPLKSRMPAVAPEVLSEFLDKSPGWEAWEDALPREYPHVRHELRKHYVFNSFPDAVSFMQEASVMFERRKHHPRWSNEWKLVTVGLTTWDAGNRITRYDLDAATELDALHAEFRRQRRAV